MSSKQEDKREIQAARDGFRALVNDASLDALAKWTRIRDEIKHFRQAATAVLDNGSGGVVAHDRRAKLAAFACEYATGYYERQAQNREIEPDELERKLGDLARYMTGIKSVPRAAPQLGPKEAALRDHWAKTAVQHYDALRGPLKVYCYRMQRLAEEMHEPNVLLPLLFAMRKGINDKHRSPHEKTLALDEEVRRVVANTQDIYADFVHVALETLQAAASRSPLYLTQTAYKKRLQLWNEPVPGCSAEKLVSVIAALTLMAFHAKTLVANVKQLYQQLLMSQRLHPALVDTFVEGNGKSELSLLLNWFLDTTTLDGHTLAHKVRLLNSYPAQF